MSENNVTYQVQDWTSKVLAEFDTLCEADSYKEEICYNEDEQLEEMAMEDIYIIGIDENGNEFAPQW